MNINEFKKDFDQIIDFLKGDISGLRTGRASTAIVEDISVEAYGSRQPLKSLATITVADAKTINIDPWDKSVVPNIEKGIRESNLGLNPSSDGRLIRLFLPDLTTERRKELIKVLSQKLENARISVRKAREEVRDMISMSEENNEIGEDEKFKLQEDLEKMVKDYNEKIKTIGEEKEKEINTV